MTGITVLYFASLRDAAGTDAERIDSGASDLRGVYGELRQRHGFAFTADALRVAIDGAFASWDDAPREDSEVAFIPPVSGG